MSLWTRLRYALAGGTQKAATLPFVPSWVREAWLEPTFDRLTREGYTANAAVNACVVALAFAFIEAPLTVSRDDDTPDVRHPLQRLLRRPNAVMSEAELALFVITYLAIGGNCMLHKVRVRGRVVELWPYHPGQMVPIPGRTSWVEGYEYDAGDGDKRRVPAADVIHLKWPSVDPQQPWLALPPLRAAAREVDTDSEATRYLYALLRNDATPRTVIEVPQGMSLTNDEFNRLRAQFNDRYGGERRGSAALLEGGLKVSRIGLDLQELAFDALRRVPETRIAAAFRVPPIVAGLSAGLERSTYANFAEARRMFTENTIIPLWRLVAAEIEQGLGEEFGSAVQVRHDVSRVAALRENEDAKFGRITQAFARGLLGRKESRRLLGLPEELVDDEFYAASTAPSAAKALPMPRQRKAADEDLEGYLKREYQRAFEAVGRGVFEVEQMGLDDGTVLGRLLRRRYVQALAEGYADGVNTLEMELAFDLDNPLVQEVLHELASEVRRVAESTRDEIRALVGRQAAEGWSIEQLTDEIATLGDIHSRERARLIARTETASAYSRGSLLAYEQSGVVTAVEWLVSDPCPICRKNADARVTLGGTFPSGHKHPPAHPGCRCAVAPIV